MEFHDNNMQMFEDKWKIHIMGQMITNLGGGNLLTYLITETVY